MRKKIILISGLIATPLIAFTYPFTYETCSLGYTHVHHQHNEASYQKAWCSANAGIEEYENKDKTRVDCLTATHAVEFDFANKWAESLGQAMHYGYMTGKKPKVVLILDNPKAQMVYFRRIQRLGKKYDIETEYVTDDILKLNNTQKCFNTECKCHRQDNLHHKKIQQNNYIDVLIA